jgi:predicted amidohydrolase
MRDLTITLLQAELDWHAPESNRAHFEQLIAASSDASDLIILPEMFTTGFTRNVYDRLYDGGKQKC